MTSVWVTQLPYTPCLINYPLIILPFNALLYTLSYWEHH